MSSAVDLRAYLTSLTSEKLVELIVEQAEHNTRLRRELSARALTQADGSVENAESMDERGADRGQLTSTKPERVSGDTHRTTSSGQDETPESTLDPTPILDTLQRLLDSESTADLEPLAKRTVSRISEIAKKTGAQSSARFALNRALELYARACRAHPRDSRYLAEWILDFTFAPHSAGQLESKQQGEWPRVDLSTFLPGLGESGVDHIQAEAKKAVADARSSESKKEAAQVLLEQVAEVKGDVDALVAILASRPPQLETNLRIVRILRGAGRHAEAINSAARALARNKTAASFGSPIVAAESKKDPLKAKKASAEPVVRERASGRFLPAEKGFRRSPTQESYAALKASYHENSADQLAGLTENWSDIRKRSLAFFETKARKDPTRSSGYLAVLLEEGLIDRAWAFLDLVNLSLLPKELLFALVEAREVDNPESAVGIHRKIIEELIAQKDLAHYRLAAQRLRKLRALHKRMDSGDEFAAYLAELVTAHKRKARLIAEIRAARIALPKSVRG